MLRFSTAAAAPAAESATSAPRAKAAAKRLIPILPNCRLMDDIATDYDLQFESGGRGWNAAGKDAFRLQQTDRREQGAVVGPGARHGGDAEQAEALLEEDVVDRHA